ncbi:hypothetical protein PC116_g33883 [Phytophthora cactorum]|nr:hypothetical protein PC116_g33883 [Phytophthora cactorum]
MTGTAEEDAMAFSATAEGLIKEIVEVGRVVA